MVVGFVFSYLLYALGIKEIHTTSTALIVLTFLIVGLAAGAGIIMWFWNLSDCLDNMHRFKHPSLVFISLFLFNWAAAIIYYFVEICPREKSKV